MTEDNLIESNLTQGNLATGNLIPENLASENLASENSTQGNSKAAKPKHIILTSHQHRGKAVPIHWGAENPSDRGPIIGSIRNLQHRNVIGTHAGSYGVYRALAVASGDLDPTHKADLTNTSPPVQIGPYPSWSDPDKIVSLDPFGAFAGNVFTDYESEGYDILPTIAITKAHINLPELKEAVAQGRITVDGKLLKSDGNLLVTKAAIDPVWYLPGIAKRLNIEETDLRRVLFQQTGGMFPELVTRPDLHVFLPPIGGSTIYIIGDEKAIVDPTKPLAVRVHDECNGSDVFGSDICTCRPYLVHGIEVCIQTAQEGGAGVIVYCRKEGRALGEVTKFLVYNARKRQEGGDRADAYFTRTECVAGVQDMRFQELMPDMLHWLGITRIDRLVSMSNMKYNAITHAGIEVVQRIAIPPELVPADAQVEIEAKKASGYYSEDEVLAAEELAQIKGRDY
ncbi:MAG: GTP cyclohydrolase II [Drouetiella hepatica Uher 2000/2452]|jgi:GTP cyclohydrolase II|uniref:GTP cyclohydrolase II n=1 Tax=Drouetiella hepatica Uher 2000/2452 TaxID=904376 RepID=A0A951UN23_9CYAN|nr:GTP cyclohydrolase II [Drouetiella hepatica Uher 2000/2452]